MSAVALTNAALPATAIDAGDSAEALTNRRFAIMAAQVASVRWAFVLTVVVMAAVALQAIPVVWVGAWLAQVLLVFYARARWLARHEAMPDEPALEKVRGAMYTNVALGLSYGISAAFMLRLDPTMSAVLTTLVVSSAAGAVAISGTLPRVYLAYTLGIMIPFAAVWAASGTLLGAGLAVLMGLFVTLQYKFARQVAETFNESFLIRRENEQLVGQLTEARDQARAASVAKTRFLAAASHDLRQPLHALSLQSSALLLDPAAEDTPAIAIAIAESIQDVSTLLDSLLDISKLDAGTLHADRRPIHLSRMLESLARSFAPWAVSRGLAFEMHAPPEQIAVTDPILLERVLRNLVDNAIKFTPAGTIRMSLVPHPGHFDLCVADTGVGIPIEAQAKVFDEFYQIDRHAHGHSQGLGLGLSIVHRLTQLLEMSLALESEPGRGTSVTLRLPRTDRAFVHAAPVSAAVEMPGLQGLRVLVLDDEPAICSAMSTLLRRLGCEVVTAASAEEADARSEVFDPRIVLADYRLGDHGNGIGAIERLRRRRPDLLALLISGDTAPDRLREASDSGLQLLHKPVSLEQLKQALAGALASDPWREA